MGQGLILMADGQLKPQAAHLQDHSLLPCPSPAVVPCLLLPHTCSRDFSSSSGRDLCLRS